MRLTEAGKRILPLCDQALDVLQRMKECGNPEDEVNGGLTVAISETLLAYKMQDVLRLYKQYAPKVKLTFLSRPCYEIAEAIQNGSVDIGVIYHIGVPQKFMKIHRLFTVPMVLVASAGFDMQQHNFTVPNQTIHTSFFINEPKCVFREIFEAYLKFKNIFLDSTIELGSIETIRRSVPNNLGVSYLPRFIVEKDLNAGVLKELTMDGADAEISVVYARHKNKWVGPAMNLFLQQVEQHVTN